MPRARPGIADADRPRGGAFASLLDRSTQNDAALDALVFAYECLDGRERRALMAAVARETAQPAPMLAALLAVEQDPSLRSRLGVLLRDHAQLEWTAHVWGTATCGGTALVQAVCGEEPETLLIRYERSEIVDIRLEARARVKLCEHARTVEPVVAVDAIVPMVWRYIQGGRPLPAGSERFAGFLTLSRTFVAPS